MTKPSTRGTGATTVTTASRGSLETKQRFERRQTRQDRSTGEAKVDEAATADPSESQTRLDDRETRSRSKKQLSHRTELCVSRPPTTLQGSKFMFN